MRIPEPANGALVEEFVARAPPCEKFDDGRARRGSAAVFTAGNALFLDSLDELALMSVFLSPPGESVPPPLYPAALDAFAARVVFETTTDIILPGCREKIVAWMLWN
jgi:hypothetical protein